MSIIRHLRARLRRPPPLTPWVPPARIVGPCLSQRVGYRPQNSRYASSPRPDGTVATLLHLETEPVWVRLLFVNDQPEPWMVDGAAIAPTASFGDGVTPLDADGRPDETSWHRVTFEAGGAESEPMLDPPLATRPLVVPGNPRDASRPVHAWSDWVPVRALPRRDGGFGFLLLVRSFSRGLLRFAGCVGKPDASIGRLHAGFFADGDATGGPAAFARNDTLLACHGVQYIAAIPAATVVGVGDSITTSSCTTGEMSGAGFRACAMVSTPERPVSWVNEGFPGRNSLGFATTGLWTVNAFRPQIAIIQAWTPNEPWTAEMADLAFHRAMAVADAVRNRGGVPILTTATPGLGDHPEAEPFRRASNERIRALTKHGWLVLDNDALWGTGDNPNRFQPRFDAGDGMHPNDGACQRSAGALAPMMRAVLDGGDGVGGGMSIRQGSVE